MTETRNCEFDHNNHPKKITTEELKDGFPGLPSSGDEVGLSGLCSYGDEDDKGGILEDGFSVLPSSVDEVGLSGLCSCGAEDDKGGILEDGLSGFTSYGDGDVKGGILGDGLSGLGCYDDEDVKGEIFDDGLSGFTSYGDEDVKGGILEDGLSGLGCYGDEDGKGGILKDGFSGFTSYGDEDVKGGILEDGLSGLCSYGVEDVKGGILEDGFAEKVKKGRICELRDPLVVLGSDIMLVILSCLDARSVALCLLVSCGWRAVASSDRIWSSKCEELWQGKTHLPRIAKVNELSKLAVYSWSVMDGKRKRIRKEDLHDHVWEFHFTEALSTHRNHAWLQLAPN